VAALATIEPSRAFEKKDGRACARLGPTRDGRRALGISGALTGFVSGALITKIIREETSLRVAETPPWTAGRGSRFRKMRSRASTSPALGCLSAERSSDGRDCSCPCHSIAMVSQHQGGSRRAHLARGAPAFLVAVAGPRKEYDRAPG